MRALQGRFTCSPRKVCHAGAVIVGVGGEIMVVIIASELEINFDSTEENEE